LAPLVTFEGLVDVVRRLPVPFLADWTMVQVLNEDGSIRSIPGVHADPSLEPLLATLAAVESGLPWLSQPPGERQPVEFLNAPEWQARLAGPAQASEVARLGAGTAALLPLAIGGRVRAVLWLVSAAERRFSSAKTLVVEDAAQRIGLALD